MLLFVVAACMIPLLIQGRLMAQSSRQMQVERRIIDVQNQCQILSNKMSRNGYLGNSGVDTSGTDTELSMLADIFNGLMALPNLCTLLLLSPEALRLLGAWKREKT